MKTITLRPLKNPIKAGISIHGSKSFTNRALVMAALARGASILAGASESDDSIAMTKALRQLGIHMKEEKGGIKVQGNGGEFSAFDGTINVGDAGTTMRFLTSLCALVPGNIILDGSERMRQRPIGELVGALKTLGADITCFEREGFPPLKIKGGKMRGGHVKLSGAISSQYITSLLLVAPLLKEGLVIDIKGEQVSPSYIDMTIDGLRDFGVEVKNEQYRRYSVAKGQRYRSCTYAVEGDASGASYLWAIAAITGGTIRVKNVNPASLQGDIKFPDLLARMGCEAVKNAGEQWIEVTGTSALRGITQDMTSMPDTAQTLAVVASFAKGATTLTGLSTLQIKETKRLTALNKELEKMGISSEIGDNRITIEGGNPRGAIIETYGDHRMAMAFAVAGTKAQGVRIQEADVVSKSFPEFWKILADIGVELKEL